MYNSGLYEFKQRHYKQLEENDGYSTYWRGDELKCGWKLRKVKATNRYELEKILKSSEHYQVMAAQSAQQTLQSVQEAINSFNELVDLFFKGEVDKPRIPRYRKSGGLYSVTFPFQALTYKNGYFYPSISKTAKPDVIGEIKFEVPEFVDFNLVREVRIRPSCGEFWIDWICDDGKKELTENYNLDYRHFLSIDHGVKNWISAVTTKGRSFIADAKPLKTTIIKYRDKVVSIKKDKPQGYWDEELDKLTAKHNLVIRDSVNKMARFIINRCLRDGIGNLVVGWNEKNKQNINNGKNNNYYTVSMPTKRLIERLQHLGKEYGIIVHVISEEYTSKASFLDRDRLYHYGEIPTTWKPSGKRTTRDEYRNKSGLKVHADLNAAGNILRRLFTYFLKFPAILKHRMFKTIDGALTNPARYDVFRNLKKCFTTKVEKHVFRLRSNNNLESSVL